MLIAKCDDEDKSKELTNLADWNQFIASVKGLHCYIVDSITGETLRGTSKRGGNNLSEPDY